MPVTFPTGANYSYGDLNAIDGAAALTWCVWYYHTAAQATGGGGGASRSILAKAGQASTDDAHFFRNDLGGAQPGAWGIHSNAGSGFTLTAFPSDAWTHGAGVFNGAAGAGSRTALYHNAGALTINTDSMPAAFQSTANAFLVGDCLGAVFNGWQGTLAHLKIWLAVLTASELSLEMRYADPQRVSDLLLYAPMIFQNVAGTDFQGGIVPSAAGSPAATTVSEPPVIYPAGSKVARASRRFPVGGQRDRFQRINLRRPGVIYG